jgi:hypothetical protein
MEDLLTTRGDDKMRARSIRAVTVGMMLAGTALLSACTSQNTAAPATTVTSTVTAAPATGSATTTATATKSPQQVQASGSTVEDVNCSANGAGKVGPAGGKQVNLIAEATKAGRVGCTEAFDIITRYYRDAPAKSEGTAHVLTVQGWKCMADTGAQGTGAIGCDKAGLALHTRQS